MQSMRCVCALQYSICVIQYGIVCTVWTPQRPRYRSIETQRLATPVRHCPLLLLTYSQRRQVKVKVKVKDNQVKDNVFVLLTEILYSLYPAEMTLTS
jgi:hypothetical protein